MTREKRKWKEKASKLLTEQKIKFRGTNARNLRGELKRQSNFKVVLL